MDSTPDPTPSPNGPPVASRGAKPRRLDRRGFLRNSMGALAGLLPGCSLLQRSPVPICPNDASISDPQTPLTVDVHSHVFNGSDLQVQKFIELVLPGQHDGLAKGAAALGGVLQDLAWNLAPNARDELKTLAVLQSSFEKCDPTALQVKLNNLRQSGYELARSQLQAAVTRRRPAQAPRASNFGELLSLEAQAPNATARTDLIIQHLPESYETYRLQRDRRALAAPAAAPSPAGIIDFVVQNFQYRYVSVCDYLNNYSSGKARKIDLLVASLVDFDWWLAKGQPTPSSLSDQVLAMEQIAIATGGRVHAFVPFDPLREVAFRNGKTAQSSLALVRDAVVSHGCIGVKMYPPMGFAASGNADLDVWRAKPWLPDIVNGSDFGRQLDAALADLYRWCIEEQVPIMAHTNFSNGAAPELAELATARHWKPVFDAIDTNAGKKLRVNFGHFGDTSLVEDGTTRSDAFMALMHVAPLQSGALAFADASYFSDVLDHADGLRAVLKTLYLSPSQQQPRLLGKRLMYGSDWEMSLPELGVDRYLTAFETVFAKLQADLAKLDPAWNSLEDDFFGRNAAVYLGLRKGGATRARLDKFYGRRVSPPDWARKVDALGSM